MLDDSSPALSPGVDGASADHGATTDRPTEALDRLAAVLGEDAIFVLAASPPDPKDALEGLLSRRSDAYSAAVQGLPHTRMAVKLEDWVVDLTRAMAPIWPPRWMPMMELVADKVTLEVGARGLRSLFSSKPSDRDVARVRRYGSLAVRLLRAVLAADGPLHGEEKTTVAAVVASLGLPEDDARTLQAEPIVAPELLEVFGPIDHGLARAIVRGAWLAAAGDTLDPREERVVHQTAQKMSLTSDEVEDARRAALAYVESQRKTGLAALDGLRYVLSDRAPGFVTKLAIDMSTLVVPRRWRDEALAPVTQGSPAVLARRHAGLAPGERMMVLGVVWAAAMAEDPTAGRHALLRARWERFAADLGEDDPMAREMVDRFIDEALSGVARTLP